MKHICIDCQKETESAQQEKWNGGFMTLVTCRTEGCLLNGVTLTPEQYATLTPEQFEAYRLMVANRAAMAKGE